MQSVPTPTETAVRISASFPIVVALIPLTALTSPPMIFAVLPWIRIDPLHATVQLSNTSASISPSTWMTVYSINFAYRFPLVLTCALFPPTIPLLKMISLPASRLHASTFPSIVILPVALIVTPDSTLP